MKYRKAYEWGKTRLEMAQIREASLDARLLLEFVCNTDRNDLYAHSERELTDGEQELYEGIIRKRAERIPLQHITGEQEFMGLSFIVNGDVLIPRQDTEILAEEALIAVNDGDRLLDMCTGSGCVLLSVMRYKNDVQGVGADVSEAALAVARKNYEALKDLINGEASFVQSDMFSSFTDERFDVIVSNPPYIKTSVINELEAEVKDHDPRIALDGGDDGLLFYREIAKKSQCYLKNGGKLLLEIGYDQADEVKQILEENGFLELAVIKDLSGNDRVIRGVLYV